MGTFPGQLRMLPGHNDSRLQFNLHPPPPQHFHDLAALESSLPGAGVANLHVKASESDSGLTMLYQVWGGGCCLVLALTV